MVLHTAEGQFAKDHGACLVTYFCIVLFINVLTFDSLLMHLSQDLIRITGQVALSTHAQN